MFKDFMVVEEVNRKYLEKIDIFDFDDTLVYVPSPLKAKALVARHNLRAQSQGKDPVDDFHVADYWYNPISLRPPIVPDPTPCAFLNQKIAREFYASQRDPKRLTIVMTGRPPELKKEVERVLSDFKMKPDYLYLMPEKQNTLEAKIEHLAKILDEYPQIQDIEMWDDKGPNKAKLTGRPQDNHVAEFKKFLSICKDKREHRDAAWTLKIKVNEVPPRDEEVVAELKRQNPEFSQPGFVKRDDAKSKKN